MPTDLPQKENPIPPESAEPEPSLPPRPAGPRPPEDGGAFRLITVAGIPIRLHFTFLLLLAWLALRQRREEK